MHGGFSASQRWSIYSILIALALGQAAGKILAVNDVSMARLERSRIETAVNRERARLTAEGVDSASIDEAVEAYEQQTRKKSRLQRPFLSGNDRSRWLAIRAIAETGSHEIEDLIQEPSWDTIDMVQHRGRDGELHQYSSKPPLLMVLIAGPYWLLMQITGTNLGESPYELGRTLLLLINGGTLLVLLTTVGRLVERLGYGDFDRIFAVAVASFGTQLSAFAPVLSNHLFAAAAAAVACELWLHLTANEQVSGRAAFGAGVAAAFAAACDLPALSLTAVIGCALAATKVKAVVPYTCGLLLVGIAFFGTTYWAHNSFAPPYAHRSKTDPADNWYDYEFEFRGEIRDSYWRNRQGIDRGEPSKLNYTVQSLFGHHGLFSLTPVWALSFIGLLAQLGSPAVATRRLAWAGLLVTSACFIFYLGLRPLEDRNYGGMTNGFRWFFWLSPIWLAMLPWAIDRFGRTRVGGSVCVTLLAFSAMSASYPTWNPWTHPWLYNWMAYLGWLD